MCESRIPKHYLANEADAVKYPFHYECTDQPKRAITAGTVMLVIVGVAFVLSCFILPKLRRYMSPSSAMYWIHYVSALSVYVLFVLGITMLSLGYSAYNSNESRYDLRDPCTGKAYAHGLCWKYFTCHYSENG